jgi:hypothetical protein
MKRLRVLVLAIAASLIGGSSVSGVTASAIPAVQTTKLVPAQVVPGGATIATTRSTSGQVRTDVSVCVRATHPNGYEAGGCRTVARLERNSVTTIPITIEASAPLGTYSIRVLIYRNNPWTLLERQSTSATLVVGATPPPSNLIWEENFNALSIASGTNPNGVWRPVDLWQDINGGGYRDFAGTNWNVNPNHPDFAAANPFSIVDGALRITSRRCPELATQIRQQLDADPSTASLPTPSWCGGMLILNAPVQRVRYGYVEFRMRMPVQGPGMFPAMWLYATGGVGYPLEKSGAEIDMFEQFGASNRWSSTLHQKNSDQVGPSIELGTRTEDTSDWHTYGVDWQPDYLRLYRDGALLYSLTGPTAQWYNTDMSIRLNYAMDAPWFPDELKSNASTPTLSMDVDYVKVYRTKPA